MNPRNHFAIVLLTGLSLALTRPVLSSPTPSPLAPADEYFGRQKLSILSITNTLHDASRRVAVNPKRAPSLYKPLLTVEDAVQDWARKYPQDAWIAPRAQTMFHLFRCMGTGDGEREADHCRDLIARVSPGPRTTIANAKRPAAGSHAAGPTVLP
ncbi:MAG: hypothetical protein GIW99_12540 [Candidatus Eremiobacteraeota bacterium]|nr:hypothetical protein [Candidatus Eremiobacteraeota bacterium]MBC5828486.1 hypothetical protein [Candidatus Eremiobacteraeota bacterium]